MEGTLRFNIDPLSQYSEEEILNVISSIGLNSLLENNKIGLNSMVKCIFMFRYLKMEVILVWERDN